MRRATTIYIDVETVPDQSEGAPERALSLLKVPGNYSKPETIAKWLQENGEKAWRDTALNGAYGELLCIGFAFDDYAPDTIYRDLELVNSEYAQLSIFLEVLRDLDEPFTVVGHNIMWDLKFLYHRAAVLGLLDEYRAARLPINPSPYAGEVYCTSQAWTWEHRQGIKLGELCDILGIDNPKCEVGGQLLDGSSVYDFHLAGHDDLIAEYCKRDVNAVREIYKRLGPAW